MNAFFNVTSGIIWFALFFAMVYRAWSYNVILLQIYLDRWSGKVEIRPVVHNEKLKARKRFLLSTSLFALYTIVVGILFNIDLL